VFYLKLAHSRTGLRTSFRCDRCHRALLHEQVTIDEIQQSQLALLIQKNSLKGVRKKVSLKVQRFEILKRRLNRLP
jgi:hypothetical protein